MYLPSFKQSSIILIFMTLPLIASSFLHLYIRFPAGTQRWDNADVTPSTLVRRYINAMLWKPNLVNSTILITKLS